MILTSLDIDRSPSYGASPNQLQGKVVLTDVNSSHTVSLNAIEINAILSVVKDTLAARAKQQVKAIPQAFAEAQAETLLIENNGDVS